MATHGCGQCMPCRINKRRLWVHRIMLEKQLHDKSCFLTLTYDQSNLPLGATLVPAHYQKFVRSIRKDFSIRYFFVGEYGDNSHRPHYHAAMFGLDETDTDYIRGKWRYGHIMCGSLTDDSAQYIAGYVVKKLTNKNDPWVVKQLNGRAPEFARMSLKPGLGAGSIPSIASVLESYYGPDVLQAYDGLPPVLQHGKKQLPLGRYLKQKLSDEIFFKKKSSPSAKDWETAIKTRLQLQSVKSSPYESDSSAYQKLNSQKILNIESRAKIWSKKGSI
ncbi:MAG: replication initiator protein [Microviridae sp.]|nr:MAG: replication initiator protein [Microviridae sp.]